jgi:tetratricopeptide (TPR) repeat protein
LAARNPKDNNQRDNVLTVRAILGRTLALTGNIEIGMDDMQQAVDIATQLTTIDPNNTDFQEDAALYASQLSRLRRLNGDFPAASALTARALAIFIALTKQDPANTSWQREFAEAKIEQAEQSRVAGHADVARTQSQDSLQILEPLFAKQPDDRSTLLAVVSAKLLLAAVAQNPQLTQQLRNEALKAIRTQKNGHDDPRLLALQIEALLALGRRADAEPAIRQLWNSGYRDLALENVLQQERIDYPVNLAFQQKLVAANSMKPRK